MPCLYGCSGLSGLLGWTYQNVGSLLLHLFVVALDHLNIIVAAVIVYLLMVLKLQAFLVASYAHFSVKRII